MKSIHAPIVIALLIFMGCKETQNDSKATSTKEIIKAEKEPKYDKDKFRRFTYFLQSDNPKTAELLQGLDWEKIAESVKNYGIHQMSCYRKDNDYLFIMDAEPALDSKAVMEALGKLDAVRTLIRKLEEIGVVFPSYHSALERIYKLDQKVVYSPIEGPLKIDIGAHKRFVWTLLLKDDPALMAEYKKAHSIGHAWPQITKNMKFVGVKDMEIYLHDAQAILIMDTKPDFDMDSIGPVWEKLPKEKEWQEYVAKFQRTRPSSSIQEKWQDMEKL